MTAENLKPVVKSWLKGTDVVPPDPQQSAGPIMVRVAQTRQRGRWWPLPSFERTPAPAPDIPSKTYQPAPIPATNGHSPTAIGRTLPMFSATKFVVAGVIVALFGGALLIAQPFDQQGESVPGAATGGPGTFGPAGSLAQGRVSHSATLLSDGRVLVIGGDPIVGQGRRIASAEVWDPATASFGPAGSLTTERGDHTATLLPDGRVLVIGGDGGDDAILEAEVWDPATTSLGPAGSLADGHSNHTATLLPDGRVLVIGGSNRLEAEVWDPATASFGPASSLAEARRFHTATLLSDGRVLVVGGSPRAEVWDPATELFSPAGSLAEARNTETATLLSDGRVLVVGGYGDGGVAYDSAEVWDPATASFRPAGSLTKARDAHTATLLPDGRVLVVGGYRNRGGTHASAEVWDSATASFGPAGSLATERAAHTATLLPDGRVLIVGGHGDGAFASAEVWEPGDG